METGDAMTSAAHWETEAQRWAAWARAPQHDAYWYYRDAFFELASPARTQDARGRPR